MAENDKTPGTPDPSTGTLEEEIPQDGGSEGDQDGGSDLESGPTVEQLKAEVERLENIHRQSLSEKQSLEEARRELAELRARANQPQTTDPRQSQIDRDLEEQRRDLEQLRVEAQDPNGYYARTLLKTAEYTYRQTLQMAEELKLNKLPDEQADEVRKLRQQRPHLTIDDAREQVATNARLKAMEKELEDLKKGRTPGGNGSEPKRSGIAGTRPVGAAEARDMMTQRQYATRLEELEAAGKDDERRQLVLQRSRGTLKIRDG